MRKIVYFISLALLLTLATFAQTASTLNLPKGQKYYVENKISTQNAQEVQGQSMESKADFISSYNIEVKDEKDNNYHLINTIKTVKVNASAIRQDLSFDSDKKEDLDGKNGIDLKKYINQPKAITIDKSGKVLSSTIPDTTASAPTQLNMITMIMKQMVGDPEQGGYGANMAFEPLPFHAKTGDTWADSSNLNGISRVTNYTIKEISENKATIVLDGTLNTNVKSEMQGMEIITKTKGKFSGEDIVDTKTGVIQQRTSTMDAKGTIGVMGQEIPNTTRVTSITTVKLI